MWDRGELHAMEDEDQRESDNEDDEDEEQEEERWRARPTYQADVKRRTTI